MTLSIDVENLQVRYKDVTAIDNLTFSLTGGKIYGLLGRNGSGKTSLLSVLAAFRKPSAGEVRIDGQPVFENGRITQHVSLIAETGPSVNKDYKISDMLDIVRHLRPSWDATYADALLERFEIPVRKSIAELSLGQRSTVGIILGLATRAPVTIFDESHLGMDVPSRIAFQEELLADFMANPRTIIISTHLIEELSALFEEVVIIDQGQLVAHDETEALRMRGSSVTGPADEVDRFVRGLRVLSEKQLGRTKSATIYGELDDAQRRQAHAAGLDIAPISLQELLVHLTQSPGASQ
jgi:ABC-2 type transport system ATP-binding protein